MIALLTAHSSHFEELASVTLPVLRSYTDKHNYKLLSFIITGAECSIRPPSWWKVMNLLYCMKQMPEVDWFMWIDTDAIIVNSDIQIESFLTDESDFIVGSDNNGINAGVFFIRNTTTAREFLQEVWNQTQFLQHPHWEQQAIKHVLTYYPITFSVVTNQSFNTYPEQYFPHCPNLYKEGDFVIHVPSLPIQTRIDILKKYVK